MKKIFVLTVSGLLFSYCLTAQTDTTINGVTYNLFAPGLWVEEVFTCGDNITFTYREEVVTYGTILRNGLCWLDRNLGAEPMPFVPADDATANTDTRLYGDLFQWGRRGDGHQVVNWTSSTTGNITPTTNTLSTTDIPGHGEFIRVNSAPRDWRDNNNNNRWNANPQENNPCPPGWRVPTRAELNAERLSWGEGNQDATGAFASTLKWPVAGYRLASGSLDLVGSLGNVWSSSVDGTDGRALAFNSDEAFTGSLGRAYGMSVRCVRDN